MEISNFFRGKRVNIKTPKAIAKIVGPEGEFQIIEDCKPRKTHATPIIEEIIAIWMGVEDKFREAAAGIISRPVISKIPTILIEMAITLAIKTVKIALAKSGFRPSALANSKLTVPANKGLQINISTTRTILPPIQTNIKSVTLTERISPKSKPIRSILIKESIPKRTKPIAKTEWANRPNKASSGRLVFLCKKSNDKAMKQETANTEIIKLKFNA